MEIHQLRYFQAIAELGNFTRAAERCHVSQPSLSQQILKLEGELGHKLFHRMGRKATLTEAGTVFSERALRILSEVDDAKREMKDSDATERTVAVGAIPSIAPALLPPLLALCKARHPQMQVRIREDFRDGLLEGVLGGELDMAIISMPIKDTRLNIESIFTEAMLLTVGKSHPLASKQKVTVDDIREETFVMMGVGSTLVEEVRRFCGDHQFEPRIAHRCGQLATAKAIVALGDTITILPQNTITPDDRMRLISKPLSGRSPSRDIGLVRHRHRFQSRAASQFIAILREHTKPARPLRQGET